MLSVSSKYFAEPHGGLYLINPDRQFLQVSSWPPYTPQKVKRCIYMILVYPSLVVWRDFVLNVKFFATSSFLIVFDCFLATTIYPVPKYLNCLTFLHSSLCFSLLSDTKIFSNSLCLNRSGGAYSNCKWLDYLPKRLPFPFLATDKL